MRVVAFLLLLVAPAVAGLRPDRPTSDRRTWTDSSGRYRTEAVLADYQGEVAYLKKSDGQIVALPLSRLSEADQQFVKSKVPAVQAITRKVISIADGDTLTVIEGTSPRKVRLQSIDAPEGGQAFSTQSKKALSEKVYGKTVTVEWREHEKFDKYKRILGQVFLDGHWINKELIDEGWAWHYREYSTSEVLERAENEARAKGVGLWADKDPTPPWDFRQAPVAEAPPPQRRATPKPQPRAAPRPEPRVRVPPQPPLPQVIVVYVTKTGAKYHRDGCQYLRQSKIPIPLSEATRKYSPCSKCSPPTGG